jgi:putative transposase
MNPLDYQYFYRRNLPHFQPSGATLFVTFRLVDSIPLALLIRWKEEAKSINKQLAEIGDPEEQARLTYLEMRRQFGRWDKALDTATNGPFWLHDPRITQLVADSLHYLDNRQYALNTFSIMSNHVHLIFTPLQKVGEKYYALQAIMHSLKRHTARKGNLVLGRTGGFWQEESFDHVVRDSDELQRIKHYILNNPVKAGLVRQWDEWPWSYTR